MPDAILRIAMSGMNAATKRVGAAAANIANAQNVSRLEPQSGQPQSGQAGPGQAGAGQSGPEDPPAFQPLAVTQSAMVGGGVKATFRAVDPATITVPDGQSPLADQNGLVALPNVDLGVQLVDMMVAQRSFVANLKTVQTAQDMQAQLLNLKS